MRHDVVDDMLTREPDIAFGVDATVLLEDTYAADVLAARHQGRTSSRG